MLIRVLLNPSCDNVVCYSEWERRIRRQVRKKEALPRRRGTQSHNKGQKINRLDENRMKMAIEEYKKALHLYDSLRVRGMSLNLRFNVELKELLAVRITHQVGSVSLLSLKKRSLVSF